jgi:hypothetical protein
MREDSRKEKYRYFKTAHQAKATQGNARVKGLHAPSPLYPERGAGGRNLTMCLAVHSDDLCENNAPAVRLYCNIHASKITICCGATKRGFIWMVTGASFISDDGLVSSQFQELE